MPINFERIEAICFDVDGTLSDTDDLYTERISRQIKFFTRFIKNWDPNLLARRLVMTAETPVNALIGFSDAIGLDDELVRIINFAARRSRSRVKEHRVIKGLSEMLVKAHRSYPLAIVSARDEKSTRFFLENSGLINFFSCIATNQTCKHTKPYPDPILWAAEQMQVPAEQCLMIGDTTVDIRAGRAAGAQTIGVLCGFGREQELIRAGADLVLNSTADMINLLPD